MISRAEELCRKLKPLMGRKIDALWQAYLSEEGRGQREMESFLELLYHRAVGGQVEADPVLFAPPPRDISAGEFPIGTVCYNGKKLYPFGLRAAEWIQHVGIFGRSGAGKTNLVFHLLKGLSDADKPFLVFDWKRNYRDLAGHLPELQVLTVGRDVAPFRFNPLIPPKDTAPKTWLKKLNEVIAHSYFLGEGVLYLLQKALDAVYTQAGVYDGPPAQWPTFQDVLAYLEKHPAKGREALWMASTLRAVSVLCFGEMGKTVNTHHGTDLAQLLHQSVVLELDALTHSDKTFLTEALLLWIHHFRLAEGERETFKHVLVIEEAHHILLRKKQELAGGEAITDVILREIRELGEAVVLVDQHPSLISLPALGNTFCSVALNLKTRADVNAIADCMLIDMEERKGLGKLEVGQALVKLQGRWFTSFLVECPRIEVAKGSVTDEQIRRPNPTDPAPTPSIVSPPAHSTALSEVPPAGKSTPSAPKPGESLLADILLHPLSGVVERYRRLHLSRRKGNHLKEQLIAQGWVVPREIPTRTGRVVLMELTPAGEKRLEKRGHQVARAPRHGCLEHLFWREKVKTYYQARGWTATLERPIGQGRCVDLELAKDGQRVAVEIETGRDGVRNAEKALAAGFEQVLSVATNEPVEAWTRKEVAENGLVLLCQLEISAL